jgi:hypothetical protein
MAQKDYGGSFWRLGSVVTTLAFRDCWLTIRDGETDASRLERNVLRQNIAFAASSCTMRIAMFNQTRRFHVDRTEELGDRAYPAETWMMLNPTKSTGEANDEANIEMPGQLRGISQSYRGVSARLGFVGQKTGPLETRSPVRWLAGSNLLSFRY